MQSMDNISKNLDKIRNQLKDFGNNLIGIFLYGSQNYGLSDSGSDMDTIVLVRTADQAKREVTMPFGKIKIYTLKYFLYRLKRIDLECYEILYTQFKYINQDYERAWVKFVSEFSKSIDYSCVNLSLNYKLQEHLHHIFWMLTNPEGARYDKKRMYWALRVANQMAQIDLGKTFTESLSYDYSLLEYDIRQIKQKVNYLTNAQLMDVIKYANNILRKPRAYNKAIPEQMEQTLSEFYNAIEVTNLL